MTKLNLNTHDIYALVKEFQNLIGSYVVNVYDINTQTICIKLRLCNKNKLNDINNSKTHELKYLIIESSMKFYLLDNFQAVNETPSSFSSKLRKHIKNKKLEEFTQINQDRVINIKFGLDDEIKNFKSFHLICEFYASGNIILTDNNYKILTLIHTFAYKDENNKINCLIKVNETYPFNLTTTKINLTLETFKIFINNEIINIDKKIKLKQFFMKLPLILFSPNVIEHVILCNNLKNIKIDSSMKSNIFDILTDDVLLNIISDITYLFNIDKFNGYIIDGNIIPFLYKQYQDIANIETYTDFTKASSNHFSKIDVSKLETKEIKKTKEKMETKSKKDKIILNIQNQISGMEEKNKKNNKLIENIELNMTVIKDFFNLVINDEFNNVNDMNNTMTNSIKLIEYTKYNNKIKFVFNNIEYNWDISKTIYQNLNSAYETIKHTNSKLENAKKMLDNNKKINKLENTIICESNNKYKLINIKEKKDYWFEQFNWFITSDGLFFVSGKNADQNEILVKKYFNDYDLYFHSEVFGSGSGILKINEKFNKENFNVTNKYAKSIEECGNFLICHTKAWQTNVSNRSYWVFKDQVSKTPESGEYNVKGAFIIRGNKNFIAANKMELGFGFLFKCTNDENLQMTSNENVEYAIPIMGIYQSMSSYKFKIKVTHGTQKIKKMLPIVINNFCKIANPYELASIKKINSDQIQRVLITNIRFHI